MIVYPVGSIWEMAQNVPYFPNPVIDCMVQTLTSEIEYSVHKAQCYIDMKIECHRLDPKRVTVRDVVTRVRELSASMVSLALVTVDQLVMKLADRLTRAGFSHAHIIIHVRRFIEYFYHKLLNDDERRMRRSRIRIRLQRLLSIRIVLSLYVSMHRFIHAYDHVIVVNRAECCENVFATPRFLSLMALIPPLN